MWKTPSGNGLVRVKGASVCGVSLVWVGIGGGAGVGRWSWALVRAAVGVKVAAHDSSATVPWCK